KGAAVTVKLSMNNIRSVEGSGAADISTSGSFKADQVNIKSSGASNIRFESETKQISVDLSGAGNVVLSGSTAQLNADVSGAGTLKAYKLSADKADITSSGAGNAKVNVHQSLKAKVSGAGDVIYMEEPKEKTVDLSGAGSVRLTHSKHAAESGSDTTRLSLGNKNVIILDKDIDEESDKKSSHEDGCKHWQGIDVGLNGLVNAGGSFTMTKANDYMTLDYGKSFSFALNLFEKDIHLYKNYVNLVTGLGFEFNHFSLQRNVSLRHDSSYTTATSSSPINYHKNNLNENLLTLPLMFEFNTCSNAGKSVHIAVGMLGGWKIGAKTRQKYVEDDGKTVRNVTSNDYNLNPFRYSLTARVGYGKYTVFASYALSEFFKPGRGPELYPVTAGIHISI
ncbi:MAG TPA: head GIN domain-containing protein, partial [Bacteroidia bacterium]|nr:head GIN domain-containing protein [Bacteroidia bacterium]